MTQACLGRVTAKKTLQINTEHQLMLKVSRKSYLHVEKKSAATSEQHKVGNYKCLLG